jgi:catechol 2,3-dioxygenase-like lactoylglutathione lyase family enzyme
MATTETTKVESIHMKLEVVIIPVSDVDRAKAFYEKLGFRLDGDFVVDEKLRLVQVTPPRSEASIIFGKGLTPPPNLAQRTAWSWQLKMLTEPALT